MQEKRRTHTALTPAPTPTPGSRPASSFSSTSTAEPLEALSALSNLRNRCRTNGALWESELGTLWRLRSLLEIQRGG